MATTPPPRTNGSRLPDWWRPKPPTLPAPGAGSDQDWWDALYDEPAPRECAHERTVPVNAQPTGELVALLCTDCDEQLPPPAPEAGAEDELVRPGWLRPAPDYYPRPHVPAVVTQAPARVALAPKTRAGLYNASAAGAGWALGLYDPLAAALADCGQQSIGGALTLGVGGCLVIAHVWDRRTRHWWPGLAWAARIPLATAILAIALWAPAAP
ncbi:hypothetical protein OZK63_21140 [Streptomyces sp. UMAF16]|nr:hypothetical protein [Streptomyces sp. UMAF16]